jgi:hypothetical protein
MSNEDEISAAKPPPPTMGAAAVLEDQNTVSASAHADSSTESPNTASPSKNPGIESFDVESTNPPRSRFRTSGIVLMCCVRLFHRPLIVLTD